MVRWLRRFTRREEGTVSMEFVILSPFLIGFMIFSIELGIVTFRAVMLERGLDIAVRDVRLGTGTAPQHDQIKQRICDNTIGVLNCTEKLRLEMVPTDLRNFVTLDATPDCTDEAEPARPLREFTPGSQNQLMLLRACLKYRPIFPEAILGRALTKDTSGEAALIAVSAFVQEPL
ncbi:MAG: TadE/TadG family type IV pilus assembly protein [Roseovarius sp.]